MSCVPLLLIQIASSDRLPVDFETSQELQDLR